MIANKPKLLLVDDETAIMNRLAPFLSRAGYAVKVAADGEAALREVVSYGPELIVLDVPMPRMDGREVLRELRRKGDWTPIILLTQAGESAERAMALLEGAGLSRIGIGAAAGASHHRATWGKRGGAQPLQPRYGVQRAPASSIRVRREPHVTGR